MIIENLKRTDQQIVQQYGWPKQLVTQKEKNSEDWIKLTMDYFSSVAYTKYKQNKPLKKDYKLFNGEFDFSDYVNSEDYRNIIDYLIDSPIKEEDVPEHLEHYSIINQPLNTLIGEYIKRPYKFRVEAQDEESTREKLDYRTEALKEYVISNIKAKTAGMEPEEAQKVTEEEMSNRIINYTTLAEHWGNKILEALKTHFNFKHTSTLAFRDFIVTGKEFHHFFPDNSKLGFQYKVENPVNVWYIAKRNALTTKDCVAIGTIEVLTLGEIFSRYSLTGKEQEHLNDIYAQSFSNSEYSALSPSHPDPNDPLWALNFDNSGDYVNNDIIGPNATGLNSQFSYTVTTAYWESKRLVLKRVYLDKEGYQQSEFVTEDYKLDKDSGDIKLEKLWTNQWYKGIKIGPDIYIDVEPIEYSPFGPPIIGLINTTRNTQGKSPLQLLKPFQMMYNIFINQIRELTEKEIGVVFLGDIKAVPKDGSEDPIEQFLWNAKERGTIFIDTSVENTGTPTNFNQFTNIDLTRTQELKSRIDLARAIKEEAWELIGITRQRLGSVLASETATGTNTALSQSYAQTEPWFMWHDVVLQEVYQKLLDVVQYIELQKPESSLTYLNDDLESVFLNITRDELLRDLWVYVKSFSEDKDMLETLKQLAQPAMQNGAELSEIADMFMANSQRSLKDILGKIQKRKEDQYNQSMQLEQQKLQQSQEQFQAAREDAERVRQEEMQNDNINKQLDRENKLQLAQINGIANEGSYDPDVDLTDKVIEQTKLAQEESHKSFERITKNKELKQKDRELDLKDKDIDTKLAIAKQNKNRFDKKK